MEGLALAPDAAAQGYLTTRAVSAASTATANYWTPERLANAKPMPLRQVSSSALSDGAPSVSGARSVGRGESRSTERSSR